MDRRLARGYARRDASARGTGPPEAARAATLQEAPSTIQRALASGLGGGELPEGPELTWFRRRWQMGDVMTMTVEARRVCEDVARWEPERVIPSAIDTVLVVPSPAVGAPGGAVRAPWAVAVGPGTNGAAAIVAVLSAALRDAVHTPGLGPEDADWLRRHLAASLLAASLGDDSQRASLGTELASTLLPTRGEERETESRIHRIAERVLDQPPGEIDRIATGFTRHRVSRLLRSWRRFFFAPPGFDPDQWSMHSRRSP